MLNTRFYAELQNALGVTLHHRPWGASEQEAEPRKKRLAAMKSMYKAMFSGEPLEYVEHGPRQVNRPPCTDGPGSSFRVQIWLRSGKRFTSGSILTTSLTKSSL